MPCPCRCTIDWKKGKNVTVKTIKKKQKHKGRGTVRTITKQVPNESFFNFFSPLKGGQGQLSVLCEVVSSCWLSSQELCVHLRRGWSLSWTWRGTGQLPRQEAGTVFRTLPDSNQSECKASESPVQPLFPINSVSLSFTQFNRAQGFIYNFYVINTST